MVLYDNLDEECAGYFEEALDYYQAEYEIQPMPEECDIQKFPSRQVIVLGRVMEYFGQRSDFVQLARKYDFSRKIQLSQTPFAVKDGLNKEQAAKLCQEFTNIGMRAQIVRSKKKPVPVEEKKKRFLEYCLIQSCAASLALCNALSVRMCLGTFFFLRKI